VFEENVIIIVGVHTLIPKHDKREMFLFHLIVRKFASYTFIITAHSSLMVDHIMLTSREYFMTYLFVKVWT